MLKQFDAIRKVPGVDSVMIVNNRGKIVFHQFAENLNPEKAESLATHIVKIYAIGQYGRYRRQSTEIELMFEKGRLLAVDCRRFVIIAVCQPNTPVSMLRMTMSVQIKSIQEDKKVNKTIEKEVIDKKVLLRKDKLSENEIALLEQI